MYCGAIWISVGLALWTQSTLTLATPCSWWGSPTSRRLGRTLAVREVPEYASYQKRVRKLIPSSTKTLSGLAAGFSGSGCTTFLLRSQTKVDPRLPHGSALAEPYDSRTCTCGPLPQARSLRSPCPCLSPDGEDDLEYCPLEPLRQEGHMTRLLVVAWIPWGFSLSQPRGQKRVPHLLVRHDIGRTRRLHPQPHPEARRMATRRPRRSTQRVADAWQRCCRECDATLPQSLAGVASRRPLSMREWKTYCVLMEVLDTDATAS